jgi:hypothetical protein
MSKFESLKSAIMKFARKNDRLPTQDELRHMHGYEWRGYDDWRKEIAYAVRADGAVILSSFGRDGIKGGAGEDTDIIGTFQPRRLDGRWEDDPVWLRPPYFPPSGPRPGGERAFTADQMIFMRTKIIKFAERNNRLPAPNELRRVGEYEDLCWDGWGREILCSYDKDDVVTLTSFGRDGKKGGVGEDADIVGIFRARTTDGRWDNGNDWVAGISITRKKN